MPINNRPAVKVVAPVPPRATVSVPSLALDTFKFVKRDPLPAIFKAVNIFVVPSNDKFPDCVIGPVPFPINKRPPVKKLLPVPPKSTGNVPLLILSASNDVKSPPDPANLLNKVSVVSSHLNNGVEKIGSVPLPNKTSKSGKVDEPVPPRATDNVPVETLDALRLVNRAPEPLKLLAEISPVAIIKVVSIPPNA